MVTLRRSHGCVCDGRCCFEALEARYGPFTSFLGAEREHAVRKRDAPDGPPVLWAHPTFSTSASTLRLIGEQLTGSLKTCARGLVLLPYAPEAPWWRLTRHLVPVGRMGAGGAHLEENRLGRWGPIKALRDSVVFSFPRAAGARTVQLLDLMAVSREAGEAGEFRPVSPSCPLPAGSLLFSPAYPWRVEGEERAGCVYLLLEGYGGVGRPACAHLHDGGTLAAAHRFRAGESEPLRLDTRSLASGGRPWRPDPTSLYLASHLGEPTSGSQV